MASIWSGSSDFDGRPDRPIRGHREINHDPPDSILRHRPPNSPIKARLEFGQRPFRQDFGSVRKPRLYFLDFQVTKFPRA